MAYEVTRRCGKYDYRYLVEARWDPVRKYSVQRTIACLGRCDPQGNILVPSAPRVDTIHSAYPVGSLAFFHAIAEEIRLVAIAREILGLDELDGAHFEALCLNQLTGRRPHERLPEWVRVTPLPGWAAVDPERYTTTGFARVMDRLCRVTANGNFEDRGVLLQQGLTEEWRRRAREPPAGFYDITKQRYYGETNPWAALGHDSERGISRVVGFGLVVSSEHRHPYLCRPWPGNRNDAVTVPETVDYLTAGGFEGLTLVADRGMVSEPNLAYLVRRGFHQVGLVRDWPRPAWEYAGRWSEREVEQPRFGVVRPSGQLVYVRGFTAPLYGQPRMNVVIGVDPRRKLKERERREVALRELEGTVSDERREVLKGSLRGLLKKARGRRGFVVDRERVAEVAARDGRFVLFSTDPEMSAEEVFRWYFGREGIEEAFRTGKGDLSLGPIRMRADYRITAYSTVMYVAWLLWSWGERRLQERWGTVPKKVREKYPRPTLSSALELLEGVHWVKLGAGKSVHEWTTRLSDVQKAVLLTVGGTRRLPRI
jgi:hypothetical protein